MKKIDLKCKIITPLFMGGAEQQPELRTQSFNGLFRYWFRLLGGSFENEKRLFGWGGEKANKGIVSINLKEENNKQEFQLQQQGQGYNYLGFSLRLTNRRGINASSSFEISFIFHPTSTEDDIKKFLCAVWCAFYLGNFGSRGRRGFGSIIVKNINGDILHDFNLKFICNQNIGNWLKSQLEYIKSLNYWQARRDIPYIFENLEIYKINKINKNNLQNLVDWISQVQSNRSGKYLVNKWELKNIGNIQDLQDFMGFLLMAYRSYYEPDYSIAKKIISNPQNINENQTLKRVIFGLPLNFYFSSIRKRNQVEARLNEESLRRASPLIFKIIQFNNNFDGFILIFKPNNKHNFKFLPDEARITLAGVKLDKPNWQILDDFINSLISKNLITKIYP
ncbi:MAG: type III-B CRISPR module RAMP protein Cmr1 [candidate division WOR-3 bacterium]